MPLAAQQMQMPMPKPVPTPMQAPMPTHDNMHDFLMQQASGTSHNPAATPMEMSMMSVGKWMVMAHGVAFAGAVVQSGPRGADQLFTTNWVMAGAERPLAGGHLLIRSMLSLEPLFMGKRGYPELFQTGETAHGIPLVDRQHPHDFIMELAAEFAVDLGHGTTGYIYAAPVGDPALGPTAYPHRPSASELPQAPLAHHLQDSTHIAASVMTIGAQRGQFGLAVSGLHGREPDENRWDLDKGTIDSWSVRGTWDPDPHWTAQLSTGHLVHPEAAQPGNVQRTTASVTHGKGPWSSSLIWGWNHKRDGNVQSVGAETTLRFNVSNYASARLEIVQKDELLPGQTFTIRALTAGYTKDILRTAGLLGAVGVNATLYGIPEALHERYGRHPMGFFVFTRVRPLTR